MKKLLILMCTMQLIFMQNVNAQSQVGNIVSSIPNPVCYPSSVKLSATYGNNISWYDGSLLLATGNYFTFIPNQNFVEIKLRGFDDYGNPIEDAIIIETKRCNTECLNCKNELSDNVLKDTRITDDSYCLNSERIVIDGTVLIQNAEIIMKPGSEIIVKKGATLNIFGSHIYSCEYMWNGIIIEPGGYVNITGINNKSSFIEDAKTAILYDMKFENPTITKNKFLTINDCIFNRNEKSITLNSYQATNVSEYPFSIYNCLFTSREINFIPNTNTWNNLETVKSSPNLITYTNYPNSPNVMSKPYINDLIYSDYSVSAYLKPKLGGSLITSKPLIGVEIKDVGANEGNDYYNEIVLGTVKSDADNPNTNIFDNINAELLITNSNVTLYNNHFQNQFTSCGGVQANAINFYSPENKNRLRVLNPNPELTPKNAFYDLTSFDGGCGINFNDGNNIEVEYADFFGNSFGSTLEMHSSPCGGPATFIDYSNLSYAHAGVKIASPSLLRAVVRNCRFYNIKDGVLLDFKNNANYVSTLENVIISNNKFGVNPPNFEFNNLPLDGFMENAIITRNSGFPTYNFNNKIECNNNEIKEVWNGIFASYWTNCITQINNNTIDLVPNPNVVNNLGLDIYQNGILTSGNTSSQPLSNQISNNIVSAAFEGQPKTTCINTLGSIDLDMSCNQVSKADLGIGFTSENVPCRFFDNLMDGSCNVGFNLHDYGLVGVYNSNNTYNNGNITCASNNQWTGSWGNNFIPPFKTNCTGFTDATQSILWVNTANPITNPSDASINDPYSPFAYNTNNGSVRRSRLNTNIPNPYCVHCGEAQEDPVCCETGGGGGRPTNTQNGANNSIVGNTIEQIANGSINIIAPKAAQRLYVMQNQLFNQLNNDTPSIAANTAFRNFMSNSNNSYGAMKAIENEMANGNFVHAQQKLNSWTSLNIVDDTYKDYCNWVIDYNLNNGNASLTELLNIANKCPFTDGWIVFAARNLYNHLTKQTLGFYNACGSAASPPVANHAAMRKALQHKPQTTNFEVYPNPSNGIVSIKLPLSNDIYSIKVYDMYGKLFIQKNVEGGALQSSINISNTKGLYMMSIDNKTTHFTTKLIIQ